MKTLFTKTTDAKNVFFYANTMYLTWKENCKFASVFWAH